MKKITISNCIYDAAPQLQVAVIACEVTNSPTDEELLRKINETEEWLLSSFRMEEVNKRLPILATRQAYKKLGKDPNRYRPSAEALCRRLFKGMGLYQIDTLVDLINLVSIRTGFSIGGFDEAKIVGDSLCLGVGQTDEAFEGIGRGLLNIEGLPVYRDALGGIGTPTSDEERTKIDLSTHKLLMIINGYSGEMELQEAVVYSRSLLTRYASAQHIQTRLLLPSGMIEF